MKVLPRKEKISQLNLVYECLVASNVRQADDYMKMMSLAIECFLVFFDDDDPDVYFAAEECLNKAIKFLADTHLSRIQTDLYRFMKKNGPERSLRGAIVRFAEMCHLIKLYKCRIYIEILLRDNTFAKLAKRREESIQNVLVGVMTKICGSFCSSMSDNEIKVNCVKSN